MASYNLKRLNLEKPLLERLEKQKFRTIKDVLSLNKYELVNILGISLKKAEDLIARISRACLSFPCTAYDLYEAKTKHPSNGLLATSLNSLDIVLQGGLSLGSITEISGPPGVGKTQFCFMLSILAALPFSMGGLQGQVIYIDTESTFKANRVKEIAEFRFPRLNDSQVSNLLQCIHVHQASTSKTLMQIVSNLEWEIIKKNVKLVIVDSLASLTRKEFGSENVSITTERNNIIIRLSATLKDLAETLGIAVFLTNQITTHFQETAMTTLSSSDEETGDFDDQSCSRGSPPADLPRKKRRRKTEGGESSRARDHVVQPALGIAWAHCVNTRLVAEFRSPTLRQITVVKSPSAPNVSLGYTIDESGINLTDEDIKFVDVCNPDKHSIQTRYDFM